MKKSTLTLKMIFMAGLFVLGCALLPVPSTTVETSPTFTLSPEPSPDQPTATGIKLENENLLVDVPSGFKIDFQGKENNFVINEMVPQSESVSDWTTLITVEIFLGEKNTTPEEYQKTLTERWFNACENSETYPVADGDENGYHFSLWQLYCPLNASSQKVEYTYLKAIKGNDSFYLVQVAFRHEPSSDEITQWMQYLKKVQVCDSRILERACP